MKFLFFSLVTTILDKEYFELIISFLFYNYKYKFPDKELAKHNQDICNRFKIF